MNRILICNLFMWTLSRLCVSTCTNCTVCVGKHVKLSLIVCVWVCGWWRGGSGYFGMTALQMGAANSRDLSHGDEEGKMVGGSGDAPLRTLK